MAMESGDNGAEAVPKRETWERPELVAIDLQAEQVLAVGCKNASGVARLGQPSCGFASGCNVIGS